MAGAAMRLRLTTLSSARAAVAVAAVGGRYGGALRPPCAGVVREAAEDRADAIEAVRARRRRREQAHLDRTRRARIVRGQIARAAVDALALHRAGEAAKLRDLARALDAEARGVAAEGLEASRNPPLLGLPAPRGRPTEVVVDGRVVPEGREGVGSDLLP